MTNTGHADCPIQEKGNAPLLPWSPIFYNQSLLIKKGVRKKRYILLATDAVSPTKSSVRPQWMPLLADIKKAISCEDTVQL